jgi:AcrR family transcriptional regulator
MARAKIFYDETAIIEKAYEMISSQGYDGFSLRGLARELDVNPMTLYHYVANRTEIIKKVILRGVKHLEDSLRAEISRLAILPDDPTAIYQILAKININCAMKNPNLYKLMFDDKEPDLQGDDELIKAYKNTRTFYWDRIPDDSKQTLAKEVLMFEILMNAMILKHIKRPDKFTSIQYFELIDFSLERIFSNIKLT